MFDERQRYRMENFSPNHWKSGKVTMDKQEGRAMVRTARCHLHGRAGAEAEICPGSRGKIMQAMDVRRSSLWDIVLP